MSFVVVFPTEPVIATTGIETRRRTCWARSPRARVVSPTFTTGREAGASTSRATRAAAAPLPAAAPTNAWPSKRSPRMATKSSPERIVRESMGDSDEIPRPGTGRRQRPARGGENLGEGQGRRQCHRGHLFPPAPVGRASTSRTT